MRQPRLSTPHVAETDASRQGSTERRGEETTMVEPPRDDEVIGHVLIEETDMDEREEDTKGHSHSSGATDEDVEGHSHGLKSHGLKSHGLKSHGLATGEDDDVQGHSHNVAGDDEDV